MCLEWRRSLHRVRFITDLLPGDFPKHLLLGEVGKAVTNEPTRLRNEFRPTTAARVSGGEGHFERCKLLWERLVALTNNFSPKPGLNDIRVTPSGSCTRPLGERARPAYYGKTFKGPWNIESAFNFEPDTPLSYHSNKTDRSFAFRLCENDFYRIEGHLGRPLDEVEKSIQKLQATHNLGFKVLAIQIEDKPDSVRRPRVRFYDVETLFHDLRTDFRLRLEDVGGYSEKVKKSLTKDKKKIPEEVDAGAAESASDELKSAAGRAVKALPRNYKEFTFKRTEQFITEYEKTAEASSRLTSNIYSITENVQISPADRIFQPELPSRLSLLKDILEKRNRKVAQQSIFQEFVKNSPGLEHLGGVPKGGTLVLVYTSDEDAADRRVVADFCLPYYSTFDVSSLEEEEEPIQIIPRPKPAPIPNPVPAPKPPPWIYKTSPPRRGWQTGNQRTH